ncbi:PREDICTED: uncharacterized protein LOC105462449 isoform X2 [Wasmannia auropunctata]|nr:PREDICTED: uncharacterized protein LOC105462449 isoform X2 [Wasmannia auropunctata]
MGSDLLPEFDNSDAPKVSQKIPILLSHREAKSIRHKENDGMSFGRRGTDDLIAALSKIAKVSFEEDPASIGRSLMGNVARNKPANLRNGFSAKDSGAPTPHLDTQLSSKLSSSGISDNSSNNGGENFNCRAIRDVYVPDIKENVPAYACTSGGKTFILSSKRFFQDRRSSLRVNIDDDTLRKLNNSAIVLTNSRFNIIPAILILKPDHETYDIHNQQRFILREQQTVDDKNN